MNNAALTQLLYCFCVLSGLLLLGTFLRAIIPALQKIFLPASVIGGFIGLMVGPIIWKGGGIPFPQAWITTWSTLPGILIVPVIASTPLGMKFGGSGSSAKNTSANMIKLFAILGLVSVVQVLIGLCVREIFVHVSPELGLYETFGYELSMGFSGGHGTAGVLGSYYKGMELPFWELAQGITVTTATFGLIGGMIIGIIAINIAARTGHTALLTKPAEIPVDMAQGIQWDPDKQKSMGKETTINSSIESLTFHLAIILAVCGVSYILMNLVKQYKVPIINQIPIWPYALVVMFAVNFIIQKAGLGRLVDSKTKSRIAGCCSDYAITAAIASMPVQAILPYIVPIMIMVIGCYLFTFMTIFVISRKVFADCWFERGIAMWGTSTGVFLSGLMLLKICDPDYKLPALNDFSVGFSLTSITGFIMLPILVGMFLTRSFAFNFGFQLILLAAYSALLIVFYFIGGKKPALAKRSAA